jgi:hypothetical protein
MLTIIGLLAGFALLAYFFNESIKPVVENLAHCAKLLQDCKSELAEQNLSQREQARWLSSASHSSVQELLTEQGVVAR